MVHNVRRDVSCGEVIDRNCRKALVYFYVDANLPAIYLF